MNSNIEAIIEALVAQAMGERCEREQFVFRESLRNLVRLAKAEQMAEIRASVAALTAGCFPETRQPQQ